MKTSKKLISLLLAVMMMVGMIVPGFSVSASSQQSNEWSAHWIWQGTKEVENPSVFTIEYDFQITDLVAGFIFGASDANNFLMWQVNANDYAYVSLRPHQWNNGTAGVIAPEVDISSAIPSKEDATNKINHMKIEANNGEIKTYVNNVLVDTRTIEGTTLGKIGFRQGINEGAKFDNIVVKNGAGEILFNEDFSEGNKYFNIGTVGDDGMLTISATPNEQKALQMDENGNPQAANTWMNLRKTVNLDTVPDSVVAKISVDSRYWMWINGEMVVFEGQLKRGPTPSDTYYEEVEIAPYLKEGENTIAVLAWYYGKNGFSHKNSGKAGFLFEADFGDQLVISDETWKVMRNSAYLDDPDPVDQPNYRMAESNIYYDGRRDMGEWYLPGYDDSSWDNATILGEAGCAPWNNLELRIIPQLKNYGLTSYLNPEEFAPYTETPTTETVTLDMEVPYNAQLTTYLKVEAPAGLEIFMKTDNYSDPAGNGNTTMSSYVTKDGVQEFEAYGWMNGQHVYYEIPAGVKVLDLKYRETGYNTEFEGSFTSDDWFFDKLWQQSVRTLYITMRDNFMDCPDRERAQWWGDVNNEMQMMMYSLDEQSYLLYKKGVDTLVGWQKSNGAMLTVCPTGNSDSELPLQNLAGIDGFWEYYLYTGDRDLIETAYDLAKDNMELFRMGSNGLVVHYGGTWDWPDWGSHADMSALENAWYVMALQSCIDMATVLGHTEDIPEFEMKLESIRANYDANFWKGEYYYGSTDNGQPDDRANAMAVLSGLASKDKYPAIKEILVNTQNSSPYMEKYVLDALCEMGYMEEAQARIKDRYYNMTANLDTAYSTLWEFWDKNAGTKNHAWTGGPLITMSKYMAGVRPTTPGYDTYEIAPDLGILNQVNCVVPSIKGDIVVDINRDQDAKTYSMEVTSPENTVATIGVPRFDGENTEVKLNGETLFVNGAATGSVDNVAYAGNDADYIYFEVQPGAYTFTAHVAETEPADSYTVNFDANEGGKVEVNGTEITVPSSQTFAAGTEVTVTAIPDNNKAFYGWSGSFGSEEESVTFTVDAPMNVCATFGEKLYKEYVSVTLEDSNNSGLQVQVNDATITLPAKIALEKGTEVTLQVLPSETSAYNFVAWTGDLFTAQNPLTISVGEEDINLGIRTEYKAKDGISIGATVTATHSMSNAGEWAPANLTDGKLTSVSGSSGFTTNVFKSQDLSADPQIITLDMGENKAFDTLTLYPRTNASAADGSTCNFPESLEIAVKADGDADFTTVYTNDNIPNPQGEGVAFDLGQQNARYIQVTTYRIGPPAADEGSANNYRLQLAEVLATQEEQPDDEEFTLSIAGEGGKVKVNGETKDLPFAMTYPAGTKLALEPVPDAGYQVTGWSGLLTNNDIPLYIELNRDIDLTANFKSRVSVGMENLALGKSVSSNNLGANNAMWSPANLTDGLTVSTGADANTGIKGYTSNGYASKTLTSDQPYVEIDLGRVASINRVILYPRTDAGTGTAGESPNFPEGFKIQVKSSADDDYRDVYVCKDGENPMGKPQTYDFDTTEARYVRIFVTELGTPTDDEGPTVVNRYRLQLAEVEIYNKDQSGVIPGEFEIVADKNTTITSLDDVLNLSANILVESTEGNEIAWSIENADGSVSDIASLYEISNGNPVLVPLKEGSAYVVGRMTNGMGAVAVLPFTIDLSAVEPDDKVLSVTARDLTTGEAITEAIAGEWFQVEVLVQGDINVVKLVNEYGLSIGKSEYLVTEVGDGTKRITFNSNIGTVGDNRQLTVYAQGKDGYMATNAVLTMDIKATQPVLYSAQLESDTAKVNVPVSMTVVTDTTVNKIQVYNEYGLKMGINSSYQDANGQRTWTVTMKIGTAGERSYTVKAVNAYGVYAAETPTVDVTVTYF